VLFFYQLLIIRKLIRVNRITPHQRLSFIWQDFAHWSRCGKRTDWIQCKKQMGVPHMTNLQETIDIQGEPQQEDRLPLQGVRFL